MRTLEPLDFSVARRVRELSIRDKARCLAGVLGATRGTGSEAGLSGFHEWHALVTGDEKSASCALNIM